MSKMSIWRLLPLKLYNLKTLNLKTLKPQFQGYSTPISIDAKFIRQFTGNNNNLQFTLQFTL